MLQSPNSGIYQSRYDAIQTTITHTFTTLFMGALNNGSYTLTVQNSALVAPCNLFLGGSNAQYTYTLSLASTTFNSSCPLYINQNVSTDASSSLFAFGLNVTGNSTSSSTLGTESQQSQGPSQTPPTQLPTYGVKVMTDPLSTLTQPHSISTCNNTSLSISSGTQTLNPGTFCGTSSTRGLTISGGTVILNPGVYIISGGLKWDNANISGNGVTIYLTTGNGASYGQVLIGTSTSCNLSLSAPTNASTGTQSILFWLDRNWSNTSATDFQVSGNGTYTLDGVWYMANTGLSISTQPISFAHYGSFVARNASFSGTTLATGQDVTALPIGSVFRKLGGIVQ